MELSQVRLAKVNCDEKCVIRLKNGRRNERRKQQLKFDETMQLNAVHIYFTKKQIKNKQGELLTQQQ